MEINEHLQRVFEHAKQMELDGKQLYLNEIERTEDPGIRKILQMLADAEQNHYEIFDSLQKQHKVDIKPTSMVEIKNIFTDMKEKGEKLATSPDHAEFYEKVKDIEEKTEDEYRKEAKDTENLEVKEVLLKIADEEHRHYKLMESFIRMCRNADQWVENAEFNHLDEY
ncbi:MAG: ferritin family protein [Nanobdellota archaeon]